MFLLISFIFGHYYLIYLKYYNFLSLSFIIFHSNLLYFSLSVWMLCLQLCLQELIKKIWYTYRMRCIFSYKQWNPVVSRKVDATGENPFKQSKSISRESNIGHFPSLVDPRLEVNTWNYKSMYDMNVEPNCPWKQRGLTEGMGSGGQIPTIGICSKYILYLH